LCPVPDTVDRMAGEEYGDPRLAAIYDLLYPDRRDLDAYLGVVREFDARRVLDIGCGTGSFALLLAGLGIEVTGLDPAQASLDVAKAKPGSDQVRWVCGDVTALPPLQVDVATMTANVAPGIADPHAWQKTLRGTYKSLRPGGRLVFETRNPAKRVWESWTRDESYRVTEIPGAGSVETWVDVIDVSGPLVAIRRTYVFAPDNDVLTSTSTLRFPEREEVEAELTGQGYVVSEVRDAPDRPGREFVFIALRPE
jgi:SAM-dependent methyltransferase